VVWGARAPHFYKWLGTGAPWVGEQQTRNWPNCTDHHESAHQNDYCAFRAKKVEGHVQKKNIFRRFAPDQCPPTLTLDRCPPLSNSFRCVTPAPLSLERQLCHVTCRRSQTGKRLAKTVRTTKMKLNQNSVKTILKLFCFSSFRCADSLSRFVFFKLFLGMSRIFCDRLLTVYLIFIACHVQNQYSEYREEVKLH